jgi:hypothetical protein
MAGTTLAEAEAQLTAWKAASIAASSAQAYTIGTRSLSRANSGEILKQIQFWTSEVNRLSNSSTGRIRVRGITPL